MKNLKNKYSSLYFPEYEDDYSAYLPVGNKNVANLINPQGNVVIGNKEVNLFDINTYSQLEKLGLTPPKEGEISTRASSYVGLDEVRYNDRKLWVNIHNHSTYYTIEVCFRKKGLLGAWYNYDSKTYLQKTAYNLISAPIVNENISNAPNVYSKSCYSSHDYNFDRSYSRSQPFLYVSETKSAYYVQFQGFGETYGNYKFLFYVNIPQETVSLGT
jgi:hypothetical protein